MLTAIRLTSINSLWCELMPIRLMCTVRSGDDNVRGNGKSSNCHGFGGRFDRANGSTNQNPANCDVENCSVWLVENRTHGRQNLETWPAPHRYRSWLRLVPLDSPLGMLILAKRIIANSHPRARCVRWKNSASAPVMRDHGDHVLWVSF